MSSPENKYTLCLETGIAGGSTALFNSAGLVAGRVGEGSTSRSEYLLSSLEELLGEAGITAADIGRIAVSLGPGSFTGLRIGIASALGLARALGCEIVGVPLLPAMLSLVETAGQTVAVIPVGKSDRAYLFDTELTPCIADIGEIRDILSPAATVIAPLELLPELHDMPVELIDTGRNLAALIGPVADTRLASRDLSPIYLQNPARSRGLY